MKDDTGKESGRSGAGSVSNSPPHPNLHPDGSGISGSCKTMLNNRGKLIPQSGQYAPQQDPEEIDSSGPNSKEQQENDVMRSSFVARTALEKVAQRKRSLAHLQQWVNQRRQIASQESNNR